ncbi:NAD(P)-binding protein [Ascobolus immersus RN42]|uniref:NAD(P)-binding protein n=1 Tax=Ascobolus immersus RN42 TaxID=1160509 RepID=A0A3N4J317_ASCIM|nr:NAD(P)-binding protein [Ascobolus immersus RN42]
MPSLPITESNESPSLIGKVAIITGASRGIGAGIALDLARRGAKVAITYASSSSTPLVTDLINRIDSLTKAPVDSLSPAAIGIRADLRDPASPAKIIAHTIAAFGQTIDILVNNAGITNFTPLEDVTHETVNSVYDTNVRAAIFLTQAVLPHLPSRGGRIVNIGSGASRGGYMNCSLYCASKAALEGLTRCWAVEFGLRGVTVNQVNPGFVKTDMMKESSDETIEMVSRATPVDNRDGLVEDIAPIVAWLVGEESRWISGQVIAASGGYQMY